MHAIARAHILAVLRMGTQFLVLVFSFDLSDRISYLTTGLILKPLVSSNMFVVSMRDMDGNSLQNPSYMFDLWHDDVH